jgi:4'-phosphopantetheinyl transferase EntD
VRRPALPATVVAHQGSRCAVVRVDARGCDSVVDVIAPWRVHDIFSKWERVTSKRPHDPEHWAGRLAAKTAVASLMGETIEFLDFEIGERRTARCRNPALCRRGHRPAVRLVPQDGLPQWRDDIDLSISHDAGVAICVAVATRGEGPC